MSHSLNGSILPIIHHFGAIVPKFLADCTTQFSVDMPKFLAYISADYFWSIIPSI